MKVRKEVGEDGGREGRKEEKFVENSKRNDLRDRRNKVAEHCDMSDIKTFHHMDTTEKDMMRINML